MSYPHSLVPWIPTFSSGFTFSTVLNVISVEFNKWIPNSKGSRGLNKILSILDIFIYSIPLYFKSNNNPQFKQLIRSPFPKDDQRGCNFSSIWIFPF